MGKRIVIFIVMMAAVQLCTAVSYSTRKLHSIASTISLTMSDNLGANAIDDTTYYYKRRQLSVRTNSYGDICHIGYCMFNREIMRMQGNLPVFEFLERYILELDLKLDGFSPNARMDIDDVHIVKGSLQMFGSITDSTSVSVEYLPRHMYRVTCMIANKPLVVTVPADCQLLYGADAVELEEILVRDLSRLSLDDEIISPLSYWNNARSSVSGDIRILDNGCYLSDLIGSKLYMRNCRGKWQLFNRVSS